MCETSYDIMESMNERQVAAMRIGLDVGTTSCKAVVFDEHFNVVDQRKRSYVTKTEKKGYATQSLEDIINAVDRVLLPLIDKYSILSISLSTALHSLMLEGEDDLLSEVILWSDTRASSVVGSGSYPEVYLRTGLPVHPMSPFAKVLWFQVHEPESLALCARIRDIKSLVFDHLTGENVLDYSCASGTGLFNIHTLSWDEDILDLLGIDESMLPGLVDVDYTVKGFSDIDIHIGASDACLSNVGLGAISPGDFAMNLGTSGAVRTVLPEIYLDPEVQNFCYYLSRDQWVVGHAVSNVGNVFNWLQKIQPELEYFDLGRIAREVNSQGLMFMPYLHGERSPHWDGRDRGAFLGLSSIHTDESLVKAALEGVFYNVRKIYGMMPIDNTGVLRVGGGLLEDALLRDLFADILGREFELIELDEAACLGAVLLLTQQAVSFPVLRVSGSSLEYESNYDLFLELDVKYRELMRLMDEA